MSKGQRGNKELKKPKKAKDLAAPLVPVTLTPGTAGASKVAGPKK